MYLLAALILFTQVSQAGAGEIFVASTDLYIIDDVEYKVTGSVPLGKWIYNITISADGEKAYLGASNGVNVLNIKDKTIEGLLTDKPGFVVRVDEKGTRVFVLTNELEEQSDGRAGARPSKIMIHDSRDNSLMRAVELNRIVFDIVCIPEKDRMYCLDLLESELEVLQLTSGATIETIKLGNYGFESKDDNQGFLWRMIRDIRGEKIYIPQGGNEAGLLIVETTTNSVSRIAMEHDAKWRGGVISPDGKRLYLNAVRRLSVFDIERQAEIAWKPLDVPYQEIAIDATGKKLFLANPMYDTGGSVAILDATTLEPVEKVVLPEISPYTVAASR
jgi:DNA-binding beta-propeller fold protein YncE